MNQIPRAAPVRQYRLGLIIRRQQETNPISPASLVHQRQLTASKSSSLSSYSSSSSLYSSAFSSYHSFHAHHSLFSNRASKASGNHHQQRHHHQRNKRRQFSSTAAMLEGDMPIYIILGINGIIFLSWNYADSLRKRFNDSTLYSFLVRK